MGLWEWTKNATVTVVSGVGEGIAHVGAQTVGHIPGIDGEWSQSRRSDQYDALVATGDAIATGAVAVKDGAVTAYNWTAETGAPALTNGVLYGVAAVPVLSHAVDYSERVITYGLEEGLGIEVTGTTMRERREDVSEFWDYVGENPGRATALGTQGVINGVTSVGGSIVGLVGDAGRIVADDLVFTTIYNLGADGEDIAYRERSSFESLGSALRWTAGSVKWANAHTQIQDGIALVGFEDSAAYHAFERPQMEMTVDQYKDIYGELPTVDAEGNEVDTSNGSNVFLNPQYGYERGISYGGQALFEVPAFVAMTVFTGGTAGAAYGTVRTTAGIARGATLVDDAARLAQAVAATPLDEAARVAVEGTAALSDDAARVVAEGTTATANATNAGATATVNTANTGATATAATTTATAEAVTVSGRSAEMVHRAQLVKDALAANDRALRAGQAGEELTTRATNGAVRADRIVQGDRAGTILDGSRVTNPIVTSGARALDQADFIEYLAKYANAVRSKGDALKALEEGGGSASAIARAESALLKANDALETQLGRVNAVAGRNGIEEITMAQARAATYQMTERTAAGSIMEAWRIGSERGFTWVGDFSRGPVNATLEGAGATLAFTMGYLGDKANAEAVSQAGQDLATQGVSGMQDDLTSRMEDIGRRVIEESDAAPVIDAPTTDATVTGFEDLTSRMNDVAQRLADGDDAGTATDFNKGATNVPQDGAAQSLNLPPSGGVINVEDFDEKAKSGLDQGAARY